MKVKQTCYSLEKMTPTSVFTSILEEAGMKKKYTDPADGRTVYIVDKKPRNFRPAFIEWEEYE